MEAVLFLIVTGILFFVKLNVNILFIYFGLLILGFLFYKNSPIVAIEVYYWTLSGVILATIKNTEMIKYFLSVNTTNINQETGLTDMVGLFIGEDRDIFEQSVALSQKVNTEMIKYFLSVIALAFVICLFIRYFLKKETTYFKIRYLLEKISIIIGVTFLSFIIKIFNKGKILTGFLDYVYIGIIVLCIFRVIELFIFKKSRNQIRQKYYKYSFYYLLVLLSILVINYGTVKKPILLITQIIMLILSSLLISKLLVVEKKERTDNSENEELDSEINSYERLFKARKNELAIIKRNLEFASKFSETFRLMISAPWGEGKTSIIKVLEKQLVKQKQGYIIYIQPMIMENTSQLVKYFFNNLKNILDKHGVDTGQGSGYRKYFNTLLKIIGGNQLSKLANLIKIDDDTNYDLRDYKEKLNEDLSLLLDKDKKLYVIVDDLDRVDESTIYDILIFIKEIVDFKNTNIILLADYNKIKESTNIKSDYLKKFMHKRIELSKVNYKEMINYYFNNNKFLDKEYFSTEEIITETDEIKNNFDTYIKEIQQKFNEHISNTKINLNKKDNSSKNKKIEIKKEGDYEILKLVIELGNTGEILDKVENQINYFDDNLNKPRTIKILLRELKDMFVFFDNDAINKSNFKKINLNKLVFNFAIIKVFFEEAYQKVIEFGGIGGLSRNFDGLAQVLISDLFGRSFNEESELLKEAKIDVYKMLISNEVNKENKLFKEDLITTSQELLNLVDQKTVKIEDNDDIVTILEKYISAIIYNRYSDGILKTKNRLLTFRKNVLENLEKGIIDFMEVLKLFNHNYTVWIKLDPDFFEKFNLWLDNNKLFYQSPEDKKEANLIIRNWEMGHLSSCTTTINLLIALYKLTTTEFPDLEDNYQYIKEVNTLGKVNSSALEILDKDISQNGLNEIEIFERWISEVLESLKSNDTKNARIKKMVDNLEEKVEEIINEFKIIENLKVYINSMGVSPEIAVRRMSHVTTFDELKNKIEHFYNIVVLSEKDLSNEDTYTQYKRVLDRLKIFSKRETLSKDLLSKIDELFNELDKRSNNPNFEYKDFWLKCILKYEEIKKMQYHKNNQAEPISEEDI